MSSFYQVLHLSVHDFNLSYQNSQLFRMFLLLLPRLPTCSSICSLRFTVSTWINLVISARITVTLFSNSADDCSVDVQRIPPLSSLHSVVSLHAELRNVRRVQERTCTSSTGVYTEYGYCTQSTKMYKLVLGVQAYYEFWHGVTSTRWSLLHWIHIDLTLQQRCEIIDGAHHQLTLIASALWN